MADNDEWLNDARERLARTEPRRRRPGSIAARVEMLRPEIQAARAAGKSWAQVAVDIADGEPLNADAVRVAFNRGSEGTPAKPPSRDTARRTSTSTPEPTPVKTPGQPTSNPNSADNSMSDMFGPMFDARDTQGRGTRDESDEEAQS